MFCVGEIVAWAAWGENVKLLVRRLRGDPGALRGTLDLPNPCRVLVWLKSNAPSRWCSGLESPSPGMSVQRMPTEDAPSFFFHPPKHQPRHPIISISRNSKHSVCHLVPNPSSSLTAESQPSGRWLRSDFPSTSVSRVLRYKGRASADYLLQCLRTDKCTHTVPHPRVYDPCPLTPSSLRLPTNTGLGLRVCTYPCADIVSRSS